MLVSMTGFGQDVRWSQGYKIQIELRSVNHRYCEIMIRMPREWMNQEDVLKKAIQQRVKRGRVDVNVTIEREEGLSQTLQVNWQLAEAYHAAADQLKVKFSLSDSLLLRDLLLIPDLISYKNQSDDAAKFIEAELPICLAGALVHLMQMKEAEGKHHYEDFIQRLLVLDQILESIKLISSWTVEEYRNKLRHRLGEMLADTSAFDENRIIFEIAILAEKTNIDEEIIRLQSHFQQCKQLIELKEPVGRRLDFLIQEMNREVNTIGSKANHTELINKVVDMKSELEKIREQVQNLE